MADIWMDFNAQDTATQARLAAVLETRGADREQVALREAFLAAIELAGARVLDVGCGTGVLTRRLAQRPGVTAVVGIDPGRALVAHARELARDLPTVTFHEGDGASLPFDAASFDAVVFDSVLSHTRDPDAVLAEAVRVLRPRGQVAVLDGDYATTSVARTAHDPLQTCVEAMMAESVNDRWLVRRLPAMLRRHGLDDVRCASHGFVDVVGGRYMLSIVERGIDLLASRGAIGAATADVLKAEARGRAEAGAFYGYIGYASVIARAPASA